MSITPLDFEKCPNPAHSSKTWRKIVRVLGEMEEYPVRVGLDTLAWTIRKLDLGQGLVLILDIKPSMNPQTRDIVYTTRLSCLELTDGSLIESLLPSWMAKAGVPVDPEAFLPIEEKLRRLKGRD